MANLTPTVAAAGSGEAISISAEPGLLTPTAPGAIVYFTESIHAVGMTSVLEAVFNANNTSTGLWTVVPLDANGNATVTAQFTTSGQYLNIASPDTLVNTITYPVTIAAAPPQTASVTVVASTPNLPVTLTSAANTELFVTVADSIVQTGGSHTIISGTGSITLSASSGSDLIYDSAGRDVIHEAPVSEFVGNPLGAASTIYGAVGGSDTIFAETGVLYNGAQTANSFFAGGTGAATVMAATHEIAFGGSGGGSYTIGGGSFFFAGAGGADTISAGSSSASGFIWGHSGERLTISSLAGAASVKGQLLVAYGQADTINAMNAGAGNTFFVYNQVLSLPGQATFSGDSTLVGSSAGHDNFALFVDASTPVAHTITIENWQASDTMFISNLSAPGYGLNTADSAAIAAFDAPGGGQSFKLSDGTTVAFANAKPSFVAHV